MNNNVSANAFDSGRVSFIPLKEQVWIRKPLDLQSPGRLKSYTHLFDDLE